jgi:hypothetical protein
MLATQHASLGWTAETERAMINGITQSCKTGGAALHVANGAKAMMTMTKVKIAAGLVLIAAVATTATVWAVSQGSAAPAGASVVTADAAASEPSATAAPVLIDLSTPYGSVTSLVAALAAGDLEKAYRCIDADPKRPPTMMDGIMHWNVAQNHLLAAAQEAFGKSAGEVLGGTSSTFDGIARMLHKARGGPAEATVEGDTATFTCDVTPETIEQAPPEAQAALEAWAGHVIRFKRIKGEWKFDMDRSMQVEMSIKDVPPLSDEENVQRNIGVLLGLADIKEKVAADIRAGKYKTAQEASDEIHAEDRAMIRKLHGRGLTIHVLPATNTP